MPSLVSVVIPLYNDEKYISKAIESVLNQTYSDYEIIVVNDGSTDNGMEIVNSFGDKVRKINKKNGGLASALNAGIRKAKGEYIAWLSSDDLFLPQKLEMQMSYFNSNPDTLALCTNYFNYFKENDVCAITTFKEPANIEKQTERLFAHNYVNGSTFIAHKSLFDKVGLFEEPCPYFEDWEMWFRITMADIRIPILKEPLGVRVVHKSQMSHVIRRTSKKVEYDRLHNEFKKKYRLLAKDKYGENISIYSKYVELTVPYIHKKTPFIKRIRRKLLLNKYKRIIGIEPTVITHTEVLYNTSKMWDAMRSD